MKRSLNNLMRKMAVTGLVLAGVVLGSLGASGCDERLAQAFPSGGTGVGQMLDTGLAADKSDDASRVCCWNPPSRKTVNSSRVIVPNPPRK